MKRESQAEAIRSRLAGLALRSAPRVTFDQHGHARIAWAEDLIHTRDDVLGILCWFMGGPQEIIAAFGLDEIEAPEAVSPAEREAAISKFSNTLLTLERQEEVIISCAQADGTEILRRFDAKPMAVLNLVIVPQQAAAEPQQQVA
jgi:hypothetical protein